MSFESAKDEFVGKAKEAVGKVTGDKKTQGEGAGEQARAKADGLGDKIGDKVNDAKDAVKGAFDGLKGDK